MSKYSEALEEMISNVVSYSHTIDLGKIYSILKEAVEKAEKYDEVEPYIPTIKEHDIRDYVLYLQSKISALDKENQELKDGVKAIKKYLTIELEHYKTQDEEFDYYSFYYNGNNCEDCDYELGDRDGFNKIKAMLGAVEDETN